MDPIPMPEVLDPNRDVAMSSGPASEDGEAKLDRAKHELHRSCDYGQTLWRELDEVRRYLHEQVADGGGDGAPSLLRGSDQWTEWAQLFAGVSSALSGPTGDSGAGETAARVTAQEHGVAVPPMGPAA